MSHAGQAIVSQPGVGINRASKRVVPMEILCLGLPRTGTYSLCTALRELGYNGTYHMEVCINKPDHIKKWRDMYRAKYSALGKEPTREQFDGLLGNCMAVTDVPGVNFWPQLLEAYPEAKVILSLRSPGSWHKSVSNTIWRFAEKLCTPTDNPLTRILRFLRPRSALNELITYMSIATFGQNFVENGQQVFHDHNNAIRKAVPKDNLLEFDVKEGWEPLCRFLGKPVPQKPFPRLNDTVDWQKQFTIPFFMMDAIPVMVLAVIVGGLSSVIYAARNYLSLQ